MCGHSADGRIPPDGSWCKVIDFSSLSLQRGRFQDSVRARSCGTERHEKHRGRGGQAFWANVDFTLNPEVWSGRFVTRVPESDARYIPPQTSIFTNSNPARSRAHAQTLCTRVYLFVFLRQCAIRYSFTSTHVPGDGLSFFYSSSQNVLFQTALSLLRCSKRPLSKQSLTTRRREYSRSDDVRKLSEHLLVQLHRLARVLPLLVLVQEWFLLPLVVLVKRSYHQVGQSSSSPRILQPSPCPPCLLMSLLKLSLHLWIWIRRKSLRERRQSPLIRLLLFLWGVFSCYCLRVILKRSLSRSSVTHGVSYPSCLAHFTDFLTVRLSEPCNWEALTKTPPHIPV